MSNIKESLINECVGILKRDDVKEEVKELFRPIIDLILQEIYPYIFLSMIFVIIRRSINFRNIHIIIA